MNRAAGYPVGKMRLDGWLEPQDAKALWAENARLNAKLKANRSRKIGLAKKIADALFLDGELGNAKRIVVVFEEGSTKGMAGWCKKSAIRQIQHIIDNHESY